ncbi:prefoldin-like protein [Plasmodium brasilianum]|uniref:Uncharacterized protein n=2 Tax=Plasmodium (Plasmodium) TaxID=418103 RepID=A0A1A8VXP3_PLAMA|nr:conserved Plasmodium protein, unknown function [Plasmodium malariae]KAI4839315.1 prefoldin-like protein [Plasmodium brasilianum]SBS83619.1 conserved Plasmodium protein, unknown function [Plasmodium malariae]SBT87728.1 conserved Plasmodium protein, unknown function [Plasmodium malariae]
MTDKEENMENEEIEGATQRLLLKIKNERLNEEILKKTINEYKETIEIISKLTKKLNYKVIVPFSKIAFYEGEIKYTNNIYQDIGCNTYCERTAENAEKFLKRKLYFYEQKYKVVSDLINKLTKEVQLSVELQSESRTDLNSDLNENVFVRPDGFFEIREKYYPSDDEEGVKEGQEEEMKDGQEEEMKDGQEEGMKDGQEEGMKDGQEEGMEEGQEEGMEEGQEEGMKEEQDNMVRKGRKEGSKEGDEIHSNKNVKDGMNVKNTKHSSINETNKREYVQNNQGSYSRGRKLTERTISRKEQNNLGNIIDTAELKTNSSNWKSEPLENIEQKKIPHNAKAKMLNVNEQGLLNIKENYNSSSSDCEY